MLNLTGNKPLHQFAQTRKNLNLRFPLPSFKEGFWHSLARPSNDDFSSTWGHTHTLDRIVGLSLCIGRSTGWQWYILDLDVGCHFYLSPRKRYRQIARRGTAVVIS